MQWFRTFDFECTADTQLLNGHFEHSVNFVCANVFCPECLKKPKNDSSISEECLICGEHRWLTWAPFEYKGTSVDLAVTTDDPLTCFVDWLLTKTNSKFKSVCFAHYGGKNVK